MTTSAPAGRGSGIEGKVAVVTGAAGGIGGASAAELGRHGAKVLLVDNRGDAVESLTAELVESGIDAASFTADVSTVEGVEGYVQEAVNRFGTIDLFHNNAAMEGPFMPLQDYDVEVFDRLVAVNVRGVFLGLRAVLPILLERGSGAIVNTSSIASWVGFGNLAAYTATKHAVAGFTRAVAMEVATTGIRVNAVCPGVIDTEFVKRIERANAEPGDAGEGHGMFMGSVPMQRYGKPEEMAPIVRFLLSDEASYVQGANWLADGGMQASG
jgi:NAD(P)-dependent dehydrogenase (short-subunit alcohol dehydrogenase family)